MERVAGRVSHPQQGEPAHGRPEWPVLIALVVLCLVVGAAGSMATTEAVRTWYPTLRKPEWTPPPGIFAPVWTSLYLAMAVAAWQVWRQRAEASVRWPLIAFGVQLALNLAWSFLFFGLRSPLAGLVEIIPLWFSVLATMLLFHRVHRTAGWLFAPYLVWVTFATALNLAIWSLNR